ncbi:2-dehydro-3-deoxygalactonokinase [Rhizobiales bacterium]|uniref:2-dehydro-3-deoxygalactonokinase n=1 Tax=Hongsoonwoonella zoysiae TaxID=2821844 RepID=UPI0015612412|nr:2-dehydro-3-deoxygalactonokinase [Hongsoonwoonella zoysiae]NRG16616.1 2-dehydro-3-deoxygalactonokinase [Hongsoonwoonella zoysiae]
MSGQTQYICVDWGTSNLRIWLMQADGSVVAERRAAEGMQTLSREDYEPALRRHLASLCGSEHARAERPKIMICGMAGSRQGWREAPYADLPASLSGLNEKAVSVDNRLGADIRIMPGIARRDSARPDVMRGEETQLLGLATASGDEAFSGTVLMPGTHSKWVEIVNGRVTDFSTAMTGELFALLSQHSILRHSIGGAKPGVDPQSEGFQCGLERAIDRDIGLSRGLFALRADGLLFDIAGDETADALSGFLIGREIMDTLGRQRPDSVTLVADEAVGGLYSAALGKLSIKAELIEASALTRAGLLRAAKMIWPCDKERN